MKYRVIVKVSYYEAWFEFDDIESAGEFAKTVLTHQSESEDCKRRSTVRIDVVDPTVEEEDDD